MPFDVFTGVVDEASTYGARSFSLHLFGEPLLYPRVHDAVSYIKQHNQRHVVLLTTNGTRLQDHLDWLITSGVDQVLWSWRPEAKFTPETKEKLRRWGKFRVRFIAEVTPKEAYVEWADWPNVEGRQLHNYGGSINLQDWKSNNGGTITKDSSIRWPCYHLWLAPAVAWNGNILLCCADPKQREVLGTFPKQTVHEIWTGDKLKSIRESHLKGQYGGICGGCDVWRQYPNIFFGHEFPVKTSSDFSESLR